VGEGVGVGDRVGLGDGEAIATVALGDGEPTAVGPQALSNTSATSSTRAITL
jgi:hypothetical protein